MKLYAIILSLLLQGCFWVPCVKASEANLEWQDAVKSAKQGEYDFAFMDFKTITDDYPNSPRFLAATFAQAEYYFLENNLQAASDETASKLERGFLLTLFQSLNNNNIIKEVLSCTP